MTELPLSIFTSLIRRVRSRSLQDDLSFLLRASESPAGFAALFGAGLLTVVALNAGETLQGNGIPSPSEDTVDTISAEPTEPLTMAAEQPTDSQQPRETASPAPAPQPIVKELALRRNETLIGLLKRAGIATNNAHAAVNALADVANMRKLQRGQAIELTVLDHKPRTIEQLRMRDRFDSLAVAERRDAGFEARRDTLPTLTVTHLVEGTITDNLYLSAKRAGLPDKVIIELIRMMSFNVDFEREIREGDQFQVYFERRYNPAYDDVEDGSILHVDLALKRRPVNATWFIDADGDGDYFDDSGESTRRALMKTPLDVAVVTSRYGRRKHPVLGYTRMHKGVDFRAPTGTPIMAAGDGVIEMAARNGSYGNYIRIRHNGSYKTAYAHLSRYARGVKKGRQVKQGQVIGYSGATGRVTAAHLHYEVLVGGQQANPLTLDLPKGRSLAGGDLTRFQSRRASIVADIGRIRDRDQQVAQAGSAPIAAR